MLTDDPKDPRLRRGVDNEETPQSEVYLILSEEERAKGFVRPVRGSYLHVGRRYTDYEIRQITAEEKIRLKKENKKEYSVVIYHVKDEDGHFIGGTYITEEELKQLQEKGHIGGCGTVTTMSLPLAETYARNPSFYGATYCCGCRKHLPVGEFVWEGTDEIVGS